MRYVAKKAERKKNTSTANKAPGIKGQAHPDIMFGRRDAGSLIGMVIYTK